MKNYGLMSVLFLILFMLGTAVFSADQTALESNEILVRVSDDVQKKLDDANIDDTLVFDVGIYTLNLSIDKNVNLRGISTSHVILKSDGINPIFEVSNAITTIQNFTFSEASVALDLAFSDVVVTNNIFDVDSAIQLDTSSQVSVVNNTFFNINTAVHVFDFDKTVEIKDNIFSSLKSSGSLLFNVLTGNMSSNCFDGEISLASLPLSKYDLDLGFVDIENKDFHLTIDSVCKDSTGLSVDKGAFGGEGADDYAFPVSGMGVVVGDTSTSVTVSWLENTDYRVDGYNIYYSQESLDAFDFLVTREALKTKTVAVGITTLEINDLLASIDKPAAPTSISVLPVSSGKLAVLWDKVSNATSYTVKYRLTDDLNSEVISILVGDTDNHTLTGLVDGTNYTVWLVANNQYAYYFQVTPYINNGDVNVEGLFINADTKYTRADKDQVSDTSSTIVAFPESVEPYPALPNEGCFIATAAFGYYSHSQVQVLRDFRDDFLLTNKYGAAFVGWYYAVGPYAATIINEYEFLKPIVRIALFPLIIMAELISYSLALFWSVVILSLLMLFVLIMRAQQRYWVSAKSVKVNI